MINESLLAETIQRLFDAGIDEPTILSTLTGAGASQEEAFNALQKFKAAASLQQSQSPAPQQVAPQPEALPQMSLADEVDEMHQAQLHNRLDIHEQQLGEVSRKVDEVKTIVSSPQDASLSVKFSVLEQKTEEINAASKAMLELLEKILETNRKILTELESGK